MRILVGESGDVSTQHSTAEFNLLESYVTSGNLSTSIAHRHPDFKSAEGEIGPMILTAQGAQMVATATKLRNERGLEMSRLTHETLDSATEIDGSEDVITIQWQDRDCVQAVRSRLLIGLLESGCRPGRARANSYVESPGQALYNGLHVVEEALRLPPAVAAETAAQFNAASASEVAL